MKFTGLIASYGIKGVGNKTIILLSRPMMLALLTTLLMFLLFPKVDKYSLTEAERFNSQNVYGSFYHIFADMDSDGETEWVTSGANIRADHSITLRTAKGRNIDQWNFPGEIPKQDRRIFIGDADSNGFMEVYLFSQIEDSLFLHCFEPLKKDGIFIEKIFIDKIRRSNDKTDYIIFPVGISDMNNDGYKTFVFSVSAGFSIYPRKIYSYCPIKNELLHSVSGGWQFGNQLFANGPNNQQVILNNIFAPGNFKPDEQISYTDHSAWLLVVDHKMNFLFEPIEFKGYNSMVNAMPFSDNPEDGFLLYSTNLLDCDTCDKVSKYNYRGELLNRYHFEREQHLTNSLIKPGFFNNENPLLYFPHNGQLVSIDTGLNMKAFRKILPKLIFSEATAFGLDLDKDNKNDFYLVERENGFCLLSADLNHQIEVELLGGLTMPVSIRRIHGSNAPQIAVQSRDYFVIYNLITNPFYYWRWLVLLLIYFFFTFLFHWSRRVYANQLKRSQAVEREFSELQFRSITNQLDPHFAFNILNTIGNSILKEDKNKAYHQLIQFSRLMRQSLEDSDAIGRSIEKETALLENYLKLQQESHPNSFDYQLQISPDIDVNWQIPKLILQSFAENALKHGLYPSGKKGNLRISIQTDKKFLTIEIEDNGIGRKQAAKQNNNSTHKGISLFNRLAELSNRKKKEHFSIQINDLYDAEQNACGTLVIIHLPAQPKFGLHEN